MSSSEIREGDDLLLFLDSKRTFLVKVKKDESFHTHKGYISFNDVIGRPYGGKVKSSLDVDFILFKPTLSDYLRKMRHATQVIYPKDTALIVNYSNIGPGSRIVEAGTGSGVLTSALAHYVRPTGKVYSYEARKERIEKARKNIERTGLMAFIELKEGDVTQRIDEENVDAVILDLATPWLVVPLADQALTVGGSFVSFSPTIEQTVKTTTALTENSFVNVETVECIMRRIRVKEGQTRPETLMIGHTGYITRARKIQKTKLT
ncbi:MAG: tRNA (adenine-N1)-methyltransferase [Candidatus Bathyarchaeota archaeon]|nr:tRNA (adenine-N1)-methyltransferase [Candidatus Bathyarchaeota archaeon]